MNDPTTPNDPAGESNPEHDDALSGHVDPETPSLFEEFDDPESPASPPQVDVDPPDLSSREEPQPGSASTSSTNDGLESLVTRLPKDHPPRWAMNWRPTGQEENEAIPGEHHPARHPEPREPGTEAVRTDPPRTDEPVAEEAIIEASSTSDPENMPADIPMPTARPMDFVTPEPEASELPTAEPETPELAPPEPDEASTAIATEREKVGEEPGSTDPSPRTGDGRLGWFAAAFVALAWIGAELATDRSESAAVEAEASAEPATRPALARPAPDPNRMLLTEQIAVLEAEVGVLRGELAAAMLLRDDHEQMTIEIGRLERRWDVALDQFQFLEASLEMERQERTDLAIELDRAQRFLDEARGTD
ncbi:MAG: hypothetical protein CMJ34_08425 [Phycisphaerae bacterium]|nr:hypothetical protein [Phycisphaerae bacterium]